MGLDGGNGCGCVHGDTMSQLVSDSSLVGVESQSDVGWVCELDAVIEWFNWGGTSGWIVGRRRIWVGPFIAMGRDRVDMWAMEVWRL